MDGVVWPLQHLSYHYGSEAATLVLEQWPVPTACEEFLGVVEFALATSAVTGATLEEKELAIVALERCLSLAAVTLDAAAVDRLQATVVERVLRNFDAAGDALAAKASQRLLLPGSVSAQVTEPLRAMLALLFRCTGATRLPAAQLLELVRGDVALAVAVIADSVQDSPAGLPGWSTRLVQVLHSLTMPDAFVALLQLTDPTFDFANTAISDFAARQSEHSRALALCVVQFEVLDRVLLAAEGVEQRQSVVAALVRTLHNLTAGKQLVEPGRLLSRCVALDFSRLGFRFLAPLMRKLIDDSRTSQAVRLLRHTCRTLSWLLVHAEFDGSAFLAESLRPLVSEWALRGLMKPAPPAALAALVILAGNCGGLKEGRIVGEVQAAAPRLHEDISLEVGRCLAVTSAGESGLSGLGFDISAAYGDEAVPDEPEEPDEPESPTSPYYALEDGWLNATWGVQDEEVEEEAVEGFVRLDQPEPCKECGANKQVGIHGDGYFEGMWYCMRCWKDWEAAAPGVVAISPWPLECGAEDPREQRGAAAMLLRAPGHLRCGISGALLASTAVQVPSSSATSYPVSFSRQSMERWIRRSSGRCPITGGALDLREALDAPQVLQEVQIWIESEMH